MASKLILAPLAVLVLLSLVAVAGLTPDSTLPGIGLNQRATSPDQVLYDVDGVEMCYANGTGIISAGSIIDVEGVSGIAFWYNTDVTPHTTTELYVDAGGTQPALLVDTAAPIGGGSWSWSGSLASSIGMMALIGGLMLFIAIIGARFLTYGQSEFGLAVIYKSSAYVAIWGVFSVLALPLMNVTPLNYMYFVLTVVYTIGIISAVGSSESDN